MHSHDSVTSEGGTFSYHSIRLLQCSREGAGWPQGAEGGGRGREGKEGRGGREGRLILQAHAWGSYHLSHSALLLILTLWVLVVARVC